MQIVADDEHKIGMVAALAREILKPLRDRMAERFERDTKWTMTTNDPDGVPGIAFYREIRYTKPPEPMKIQSKIGFKVTLSCSKLLPVVDMALAFTQEVNVVADTQAQVEAYFKQVTDEEPSLKITRIENRGPIVVVDVR